MPRKLISLQLRRLLSSHDRDMFERVWLSERPIDLEVQGRWLNEDGQSVGAIISLGSGQAGLVEGYDGAGGIAWHNEPLDVALPVGPPEGAKTLEISINGGTLSRIPTAMLALSDERLGEPIRERIPSGGSPTYLIQVVAERFSDLSKFRELVDELHAWTVQQCPFNEPGIGDKLAYEILFWPTDTIIGLFDTPDSAVIDGRLFYGNRELAARLLRPYLNPRFPSVILINSSLRGGAGGSAGYSAWASVGSDDWKQVCLHELGHGFHLADEYVEGQRGRETYAGEPNVAVFPRAGDAPWHADINVSPDLSPSNDSDHQGPTTAQTIGTFAGARYRATYYRPMRDCLMRSTVPGQRFCAVCADVVRKGLRE